MYNTTVSYEDKTYSYGTLCARWNGYCYDNEVLRLASIMPQIESGQIQVTYPLFFDPSTFEVGFILLLRVMYLLQSRFY